MSGKHGCRSVSPTHSRLPRDENRAAKRCGPWPAIAARRAAAEPWRASASTRHGEAPERRAQRDRGGADLLVRAKATRVLEGGGKMLDSLRTSPAQARHEVRVDRASARRASRDRKSRLARVGLRWRELVLPVPAGERGRLGSEPFRLTAVHAVERHPPGNAEALERLLLTTRPAGTAGEARRMPDLHAVQVGRARARVRRQPRQQRTELRRDRPGSASGVPSPATSRLRTWPSSIQHRVSPSACLRTGGGCTAASSSGRPSGQSAASGWRCTRLPSLSSVMTRTPASASTRTAGRFVRPLHGAPQGKRGRRESRSSTRAR